LSEELNRLRQSEARYRSLFDEARDMMHIVDADGCILDINQTELDTLGYSRDELIGRPVKTIICPEYRKDTLSRFKRLINGETIPLAESALHTKDGECIHVEVSASPQYENGKVVAGRAILRDISERKQIEQKLQESEKTYRGIFNALNEAVYIIDAQGRFIDVNEGAVRMYGWPHEYFIGKTPADLASPGRNDMAEVAAKLARVFQGEVQSTEFWGIRSNGKEFAKDVHVYPGEYFGQKVAIVVARDITERKQSEERLQLTQFALDHAPDAVYWMEADGRFVYVNDAACEMLGYAREELLLMGVKDIDPGLSDGVPAEMAQATRDRGPQRVETIHRTKDGRDIPVEVVVSCIVHAGREYHCSFVRDITERKRNEQGVAQAAGRLRRILDADFDAVIVHQDMRVVFSNKAAQSMFGFTSLEKTIGVSPLDFMDSKYRSVGTALTRKVVRTGKPSPRVALNAINQNGCVFPMEIVNAPIEWSGKPAVVSIFRDISERKKAEEMVRQEAARLQLLLDAEFDAVIVQQDDKVRFANMAARDMFGYDHKESTIGKSAYDYVHPKYKGLTQKVARRCLRTGMASKRSEILAVSVKSGDIFPIEISSTPIVWLQKPALVVMVRDITERKAAERAVQDSEKKYRSLFDDARDLIHITDAEGRITDVNRAEFERLGYTRKEMIGRHVLDFVHPEDLPTCQACFSTVMGGCPKEGFETRFITSHGVPVWVEIAASPQIDAEGKVLAVRVIMHDVTQRKLAEQELRASEYRYRHLIELMPDGIVLHEGGKVVFANPEALKMFGYDEDAAIGQPILERIHPDDRAMALARVQKLLQQGYGLNPLQEERMLRLDGSIFTAETASAYVDNEGRPAVLAVLRDVSQRKAAEQGLKESEQRFRAYVEQAGDVLFVHDLQGRVIDVNEQACSVLGYSRDEMLRMAVVDVDVSFDLEAAQRFWKSLEPGIPATIYGEHRRKDGSTFPVEIRVGCFALAGGRQFLAIARDISERKAAEQALRDSEQRLQKIVSASPVPMVITRVSDGGVLFANAELREMFGFVDDLEILRTMTPGHYVRQEARAEMISQLQSAGFFKGEIEYRRLNGDTFWALVSARIMQFGDETAIIGLLIDMTDQRMMQEQLRQSQKMESVGTMAGGIAHDFNNMLAGMLGQLFLLRKEISDRPESVERIAKIEQQGFRAAGMIEQMLTFARKSQVSMQPLPLASLLKETLKLHRVIIPENIALESYFENSGIMISGDAAMVQQMVLNLMSNARDAVAGIKNPTITISLDAVAANDGCYQRLAGMEGKNLACLTVRDNGCGIPKSLQAAVFDPFFTTKEVGKGTGLGLAMVYGGMQTHGGAAELTSELGVGTEFRLYFPRIDDGVCEAPPVHAEATPGDGAGVLVADDEAVLREVLQEALQGAGYRVFAAADGEEAVRLFEQHGDDIDIAILDVVMPRMGGVETFEQLRRIDPELPIIFHTGYGRDALDHDVMMQPLCDSITKPVSIEQLTDKMAMLLRLRGG